MMSPEVAVAETDAELFAALSNLDVWDQETAHRMPQLLSFARSKCPVVHSPELGGYWLVTRYEDVQQIVKDPITFSNAQGITVPHLDEEPNMPPEHTDPPIQRDYRRLLNPYLSPAALDVHRDVIADAARQLISGFVERGECEFVSEFASQLPVLTQARVILSIDDEDGLRELQRAVSRIGSDMKNAGHSFVSLQDFCTGVIADRTSAHEVGEGPKDDVVAALLDGEIEGRPLTHEERVGTLMMLVLAGLETSSNALANIVLHVARTPGLEARLRDPAWLTTDLDELLRHVTPVQFVARHVTRDTEVGGQKIRAGEWVVIHYGSANRDESAFDHPDELDFERQQNRHLAFGLGTHRCIGSNQARLVIAVGIETLLSAVENIRLAPDADIEFTGGMSRKPKQLPIVFEVRS